MGIENFLKSNVGIGLLTGGVGLLAKKAFSKKKAPQPAQTDPAEALKVEETKKKEARQRALSSLNPTGTLGAGTPETTRRTTLGV